MRKPSLPCSGSVTVNEFLFVMLQIVFMTDQEPKILFGLPSQLPHCFEISRELVAGDIPLDAGREPVIAFSFDPDKSSLAFDEAIRVSRAFQPQVFETPFASPASSVRKASSLPGLPMTRRRYSLQRRPSTGASLSAFRIIHASLAGLGSTSRSVPTHNDIASPTLLATWIPSASRNSSVTQPEPPCS